MQGIQQNTKLQGMRFPAGCGGNLGDGTHTGSGGLTVLNKEMIVSLSLATLSRILPSHHVLNQRLCRENYSVRRTENFPEHENIKRIRWLVIIDRMNKLVYSGFKV